MPILFAPCLLYQFSRAARSVSDYVSCVLIPLGCGASLSRLLWVSLFGSLLTRVSVMIRLNGVNVTVAIMSAAVRELNAQHALGHSSMGT
ncbi:hypothetical protein EV424DRAFT_1367485 [Suillus variegatus]|nr:hypothetical protein EV424DRAFT_1367485 [Suillus variegatus]